MVYSGIFRTIDIFSKFQARYSGIAQDQFMLIMNLFRQIQVYLEIGLFRHITFHAYSGIFTKLHSWLHVSRNIFPHSGIFQ